MHSLSGFSQITFESGYFITKDEKRVTGFIKNIDWRNSPKKLKFKPSLDSQIQIINIETISEFGFSNTDQYKKYRVKIDRSNNNASNLSSERAPDLHEEFLFLKVLIEGKASLYSYESNGLSRFFYRDDNSNIEQLIFKKYKTANNEIKENDMYKQQLQNALSCASISSFHIDRLKYEKRNLVDIFLLFNLCKDTGYVDFETRQQEDLFNLSLRPGLSYTSLALKFDQSNTGDVNFDGGLFFRYAIETEFIMPFNKNKWSIVFEPSYLTYGSIKYNNYFLVNADYSSLEMPIGIRYYLFFRDGSKLFFNLNYVNVVSTKSEIRFKDAVGLKLEGGNRLNLVAGNNFAFGIGYKKNKTSIELRYGHNRELLTNNFNWNASYSSCSLIMGYTLF